MSTSKGIVCDEDIEIIPSTEKINVIQLTSEKSIVQYIRELKDTRDKEKGKIELLKIKRAERDRNTGSESAAAASSTSSLQSIRSSDDIIMRNDDSALLGLRGLISNYHLIKKYKDMQYRQIYWGGFNEEDDHKHTQNPIYFKPEQVVTDRYQRLSQCKGYGEFNSPLFSRDANVARFWMDAKKNYDERVITTKKGTIFVGINVKESDVVSGVSPGKYVLKVIRECTWKERVKGNKGNAPKNPIGMFATEVSAHRRMGCSFVGMRLCRIFMDTETGSLCMVMSMPNDTLATYSVKTRHDDILKFAIAGSFMCLWGMHSQGLCHCDVKPENIGVVNYGSLGALNQGILDRILFTDFEDAESVFCPQRRTFESVGTQSYVSAEIYKTKGHPLGFYELMQNDVWALGACIMEMYRRNAPPPLASDTGPQWSKLSTENQEKISLRAIEQYIKTEEENQIVIPIFVKKFLKYVAFSDNPDNRDISAAIPLIMDLTTTRHTAPTSISDDLIDMGAFSWHRCNECENPRRFIPLSICSRGIPKGNSSQYFFAAISDQLTSHYHQTIEQEKKDNFNDPEDLTNMVRFAISRDLAHLSMFLLLCVQGNEARMNNHTVVRLFVGAVAVYSTICDAEPYNDVKACVSLYKFLMKAFSITLLPPTTTKTKTLEEQQISDCTFEFLEEVDYDIDRPTPTARLAFALWGGYLYGDNVDMTAARVGVFLRCALALRCAYVASPEFVTKATIEKQAAAIFYFTITNASEQYSWRFAEPLFTQTPDPWIVDIAKNLYMLSEKIK